VVHLILSVQENINEKKKEEKIKSCGRKKMQKGKLISKM
jgi:hypothetical protein